MNIKNIFLTTIIGSMMTMPTMAQRKAATINDNWEFKLPTSQKWTSVNIPHTYTLDAYQGRNYYKGKAEYRAGAGTLSWSGAYGTHFFMDRESGVSFVVLTNTTPTGMAGPFAVALAQAVYDQKVEKKTGKK